VYKICSMMGIGPRVALEHGYDLVCYNDCVEFQMELCEEVGLCIDPRVYEADIKRCLGVLHSLKIVHRDIKK
jgi:serine/threonine protein kinase